MLAFQAPETVLCSKPTKSRHGMSTLLQTKRLRFGPFEVVRGSHELFKHGIRLRIQDQPFQILLMLVERPGELVGREELRQRLWAEDTFVDFDAGLNAAIRRLRDVLNDSPAEPRYIETVPRHGYRFIAPVESVLEPVTLGGNTPAVEKEIELPLTTVDGSPGRTASLEKPTPQIGLRIALALAAVLILTLAVSVRSWRARLFSTNASAGIHSLAILPLQNLSGDANQDYFADAMTDALITNLAEIGSLRVISRTSAMRYKQTNKRIPEIANELNVDALLEGTVVRSGDRVRLDVQLVRGGNESRVWGQSYNQKISDILALQSDLARAIRSEVEAKLSDDKPAQAKLKAVNPEAYEAFLRGRYFYTLEDSDYDKAAKYYQKSIDLDPGYAPAHLGLGETYGMMAFMGIGSLSPKEAWDRSEKSIIKTLELDPNSSLAHTLLGMNLLLHRCDRAGADKELEIGARLDPNDMDSLDYHSYYLLTIGEKQRAIAEKRRVVEHDPVAASTKSELGMYLQDAGQFDEAIRELEDSLELDPNSGLTRMRLGAALRGKQQYERAITEIKKALATEIRPRWLWNLGLTYFKWGKIEESKQVVAQLVDLSKKRYVSPILIADLYAMHGDRDQAMAWLTQVKTLNSIDVEQAVPLSDSNFNEVRSDPRFAKIEVSLKNTPGCH